MSDSKSLEHTAEQSIYIDADSCPQMVRNHVITVANAKKIPLYLVANHEIAPLEGQSFYMIVCSKEKDAADDFIVENCKGGKISFVQCADDLLGYSSGANIYSGEDFVRSGSDVVITRDILLAKRLLDKKVCVMNDRGLVFEQKNIDKLLKEREEDLMYVSMGLVHHSKGSNYNKKEFAAFANSFGKVIPLFQVPCL